MKKGVYAALSVVLAVGLLVPAAAAEETVAEETSAAEAVTADAAEKETSAVEATAGDGSAKETTATDSSAVGTNAEETTATEAGAAESANHESAAEASAAEASAHESAADTSASDIRVQVDGKLIAFPDAQPYLDPVTNRTMVPVRFVSEALGATVTWDPVKKKVRIVKDGKVAVLIVGSKKVDVHNRTFYMDATPVLRDGRTYVPLRFVSEAFNQEVTWDEKEHLVTITPLPVLPERTDSKLHERNPAAEAAMVSFVNSIQVKDGYVEAVMPKTPEGYRLKMDYYDESDGVWGNREFDVIELQDKYKAGEKIKIQIHGKGGFFTMGVFKGAKGVGSVSVRVPSLETTWFNEREL